MRSLVRDESGFTMVELMLTTAIGLVIMFATLGAFDAFGTASARNDKLTDAQDQARLQLGKITDIVRDARAAGSATTAIQTAAANDLVISTTDWPGKSPASTTPHLVRYCVDTTARTLYFDGMLNTSSGSTSPGASCPSTSSGWTHSALITGTVANTAAVPLFRYDSATASTVRAISMDLRLDAGTRSAPKTIALRTAAFLRTLSGSAPALGVSDLTVTCNGPTALLGLAASFDANGDPLTATYTTAGGIPLGAGSSVSLASNVQGDIKVTITNVLGLSQVLTKTVSC